MSKTVRQERPLVVSSLYAAARKHGVPSHYHPLILMWVIDAADFRKRAAELRRNLSSVLRSGAAKQKAIIDILETADQSPGAAAAIDRGKLELLAEHYSEEPERLSYLYLINKRGRPTTDEARELHALIMNLMGMWQEWKGELPAMQGDAASKEVDDGEDGEIARQPFIAMVRDLLSALSRADLIRGVEDVARKVRAESSRPQSIDPA